MTQQLVFTSRELVKKKGAPVGEWLATFTLFPLSPVQKAGNNGTEKLLSTLDRVSCTVEPLLYDHPQNRIGVVV